MPVVSWLLLLECTPLDDSLWPLHAACGEWPAADASDSDLTVSSSKSSAAVAFTEPPAVVAVLYIPWYTSRSLVTYNRMRNNRQQ